MYGDDKTMFKAEVGEEQIDTRVNPKSSKELPSPKHNHADEPLAFRMFNSDA